MSNDPLFVKDGDTIVVIAKTQGPTVSDPCDEYPYVSQAYRVVAYSNGTLPGATLALVPLGSRPTRVSQIEVAQFDECQKNELVEKVNAIINEVVIKLAKELNAEESLDPTETIPGRCCL